MPSESLISQIEDILGKVVNLGGQQERTSMVPNLNVIDSSPAGLDGFVIVSDDKDGDNILAKKVGSIVYTDGDKINTLFVEGTEAVAFQQGSESQSTGNIWEIVPNTSTDIFYDRGDVGIGKSVAPDASLEVLDTTQAQLRLTHTEDTKFVNFTLDTNHDLTITPSSTGQVIFQPTTDSTDFFQVLDANGGTPVFNVDSTNEAVIINSDDATFTDEGVNVTGRLLIERPDAGAARGAVFSSVSDNPIRNAQNQFNKSRSGVTALADADRIGDFFWAGHDGTDYNRSARFGALVDGAVAANTVPMAIDFSTSTTNLAGLTVRMHIAPDGDIGIPTSSPAAQLHIDQSSASAAEPVLLLDQADVDEPFVKFIGSAAAATLTRSIVDEGDVTTATRIGWVKIEIDDVGNQVTDGDYFVPFYSLA